MLKELKRKSIQSILVTVIICLVIAGAVYWYFLREGCSVLLKGKQDMDSMVEADMGEYYVDATMYGIYDCYAYTTEEKNNVTVRTTAKDYVIPFGETSFMGLAVQGKYIAKCDDLMEATWDFLDYKTDDIPQEKQFRVSGTIRPMDEETLKYYYEYVGWDELDAESQAFFLPYYLDVDKIGSLQDTSFYLVGVLVIALTMGAIWMLVKAFTGQYQEMIKKYVQSSLLGEETAMAKVEAFYQSNEPSFGIRMNSEFIMFQNGAKTIFLPALEILWAYQQTTTHRTNGIKTGTSYNILLRTKNGKQYVTAVGNSEDSCREFLSALNQRMPHIILGYKKELLTMYNKNRSQMIEISDNLLREAESAVTTVQKEESSFDVGTSDAGSMTDAFANPEGNVPEDDPFASVLNKK